MSRRPVCWQCGCLIEFGHFDGCPEADGAEQRDDSWEQRQDQPAREREKEDDEQRKAG